MKLINRSKFNKCDINISLEEWQNLENDFAAENGGVREVKSVKYNKDLTKMFKNSPEVVLVTVENNEVVRQIVCAELNGEYELMDYENVRGE